MDRYRLSIAYFAPQTLYFEDYGNRLTAQGSKLTAPNITLQKERQRTGGSRNNGTTELWNHGTTDLRNKGISIFLYPLDFCLLSLVDEATATAKHQR